MGFSKMQKMAENWADPVIVDKDGISSLVIAECSYEVLQMVHIEEQSCLSFYPLLLLFM